MIRRLEVRYRDQARTELDEIFWYIAEASQTPGIALRYVQRVEARCQLIGDAPHAGRKRDDLLPELRTVPFENSALICYVVAEDGVWITNILRRGRDVDTYFRGGLESDRGP